MRIRTITAATAIAVSGLVSVHSAGVAMAEPTGVTSQPSDCPALYVLNIQGTGQSSPDAATDVDTGFLSQVMSPLLTMAGSEVERDYVPYEAGFGGAVPGGAAPYTQSVQGAVDRASAMADDKLAHCPKTRLGLVGYSQGANAVELYAKAIGAGTESVTAEQVAGVATFGSPTRKAGSPVFPDSPTDDRPQPAPGTSGVNVDSIGSVDTPTASGSGIGPTADIAASYGSLAGRVATFCTPGDLSCDAPVDAPIAHLVTNIAGQSDLNPDDPIAALSTIGQAVALTSVKTAVSVVNNDVSAPTKSLDSLSYQPTKSISQRLADASDPNSPMPTADQALAALFKVGTIGLNAVVSVVKKTFTPETIAAVAGVGLANPAAALTILGSKLAGAVVDLVPPATQSRLVNQAFTALKTNITDNSELLDVTTYLKYFDTVSQHGSYGSIAATATGDSPVAFVAKWFAALANDIAGTSFTATDAGGNITLDTDPWSRSSTITSAAVTPTPNGSPAAAGVVPTFGGDANGLQYDPFAVPSAAPPTSPLAVPAG